MSYVLYVAPDAKDQSILCPGSLRIKEMIKDVQLDITEISVEDLDSIPQWLTGTPTLVEVNDKRAFAGQKAIDKVSEIVSQLEKFAVCNRMDVGYDSDKKVTEDELQRYMKERNNN